MKSEVFNFSSQISHPFVYLGFKGASTSQVIGARNEMMMDDYDGQMIFGDLVGLKLPDIRLAGEEKPRKNLTQETCPDRGRIRARCEFPIHFSAIFILNSNLH